MNIRALFVLVAVLLIGHTSAVALPSYTPDTPLTPDEEFSSALIVHCGFIPEFDPALSVMGLLSPSAEANPDQQDISVPLSNEQSPTPVPEASTVALVCLGLFAIWRVKTSLNT